MLLALSVSPGPPRIGIVEIRQQLHSVGSGPFSDLNRFFQIIIAPSIAIAVGIIGIIPDAHPDIIDACFLQRFEYILFLSGFIVKGDAALFQSDDTRNINPFYKILVKP